MATSLPGASSVHLLGGQDSHGGDGGGGGVGNVRLRGVGQGSRVDRWFPSKHC